MYQMISGGQVGGRGVRERGRYDMMAVCFSLNLSCVTYLFKQKLKLSGVMYLPLF